MIEVFVSKLEHKHKRNQQRDLEKFKRCSSIPIRNENSIRTNSMSIIHIHTILFIVIISSHIKENIYFFKIIVNSTFLYFVHGLNIQNVSVQVSKN